MSADDLGRSREEIKRLRFWGKRNIGMRSWERGRELIRIMERAKWAYQNVLKENKVENRFDNFLQYLLNMLNLKYVKSVGHSISQNISLHLGSDCALVYNPQGSLKHPKLVLHIPSLYESGCDHSPHFVMMAVIAKMILDKDQDFESLISKKIGEYISSFETANRFLETDGRAVGYDPIGLPCR